MPADRRRSWFRKPPLDEEIDGELAFHLEMRAREYRERGLTPEAAREAALRRFGDLRRTRASCRRIGRARDNQRRRREYLAELRQDLRFGLRQLGRSPGFALVAILTLAVGIGGTAAIFSIVNAVVLRPLPMPDPDRLVVANELWRGRSSGVSAGNFLAWKARNTCFAALAASSFSNFNLVDGDRPERVTGARVTGSFFAVLGMAPRLGRTLGPGDERPGRENVVVLSDRLWTTRFGRDPGVLGRTLRLNGQAYSVVGVMPQALDFRIDSSELWVPLVFTPRERANFDDHQLNVDGRLKAGVTIERARAELATLAAQLRKEQPRFNDERGAEVRPAAETMIGDHRQRLFVLLGAVGLVLLLACANVGNLLLARASVRATEISVRAALGAGRGRMVRQLLTESLLLGFLGAAAGLLLAQLAIKGLLAIAPAGVPRLEQASLDAPTIAFTALLACASSVLFGLTPALRATRTGAAAGLNIGRTAGLGRARDHLRSVLVAVEVALALVLFAGSTLLIRTALALERVEPGFDPTGVLSARVALPDTDYRDPAVVLRSFERLAETTQSMPGVISAAVVSQIPFGRGNSSNGLIPEGRPLTVASAIDARRGMVSSDYFATMRIPIRRGRPFTAHDRQGAQKVMIVNETLARQAWPGQDPIGKRIACCEAGPDGESPDFKVVVGVAGDLRTYGLATPPRAEFYLPIAQAPAESWDWGQRTMILLARTAIDPAAAIPAVRRALASIDTTVPLFDVRTMEERLDRSLRTTRFNTTLLTTLGMLGLLLAAIGIYGVIAYFVSQRTQEIGVRLALGASDRDVMVLVVRQALRPVLLGIVLGMAGALAATRLLETQLYGVTARDPLSLALAAAAFVLVGLLATWAPARRALRIDPARAVQGS